MIFKNKEINQLSRENEPKILKAPIDFKEDEKKALDWGNENYGDWYDDLSRLQKNAILRYSKREWEVINQFLTIDDEKKFQELNPEINIEEKKQLIDLITKALENAVTPESLIVYRRIPEYYIDQKVLQLRNDDGETINYANYKNLRDNFSNIIVPNPGFISTSLTSNLKNFSANNRKMPIVVELIVPQGTNAGFLAGWKHQNFERELLIQRGYSLKFLDYAITEENDKEIVWAKAELIKNDQ